MKIIQVISISFVFLLIATNHGLAQNWKIKKAEKLYTNLAYHEALPLFERAEKQDGGNFYLWNRIAYCNYFMGNSESSEMYLLKCADSAQMSADDYFYLAQSFKQNGKYLQSDSAMLKMHNIKGTDFRAVSFIENKNYFQEIQKKGSVFEIKNLKVNSAYPDFGGYPSADENSFYYVSGLPVSKPIQSTWSWNYTPFLDLYRGKRADSMEINQTVRLKKSVNSNYHEGPLCFSADGKTVFFTRNNLHRGKERRDSVGNQNLMLFVADVKGDGTWENIRELPFNSKSYSVGHPTLSVDNKTLYFVSDMPGGFGKTDIYSVSIEGNNTFGKVQNLGDWINTEGSEMFPWMDQKGNFFFSSDGFIGLGGLDVFVVLNGKKSIIPVGMPVNSSKDDFAFIMLSDGKTGYFSSNRTGGKGSDDIYSFFLLKPFESPLEINLNILASKDEEFIPGTKIQLRDSLGNEIGTGVANENGKWTTVLQKEYQGKVTVTADNEHYYSEIATFDIPKGATKIEQAITLNPKEKFALQATVTNANTGTVIDSVLVKIEDLKSKTIIYEGYTNLDGICFQPMKEVKENDRFSLQVTCQKTGYLPVSAKINVLFDQEIVEIDKQMSLNLVPLEKGMDLASIIEIKPIYFDLNKYNIRPDAAVELEKIIKVMNDYPTMVIELGSHTDCRSSYAYNEKLSDNRAKASAAYIKARISNPERIYGKGYGEYKLKNDCACEGPVKSTCSEAEHQENRRTEFIIINF